MFDRFATRLKLLVIPFRMTSEKFAMAHFQFRLSALVAACRATEDAKSNFLQKQ
jgi:hypothetical protein